MPLTIRFILRAGAILTVLLLPWIGRALVFEPLSVNSLAADAELIVHGKVLSKTCLRDSAGRIYTRVELEVVELWKGAVQSSPFIIVHGGGILGEAEAAVSGQAEYQVGEEVVTFLVRNARGEGVTLGLFQGKFHVWDDLVQKTKYVSNSIHGSAPPLRAGALQSVAGTASTPKLLPLVELKRRVLEAQR